MYINFRNLTCLLLICFNLLLFPVEAQRNGDLKGQVKDKIRNTPIESCHIRLLNKQGNVISGTMSNAEGNFELTISSSADNLYLEVSHVIYQAQSIPISTLQQTVPLSIYLIPRVYSISDVTVCSSYSASNKGNNYMYTPMEASSSISIIGEPDVVRHISSMPGVSQGMEGTLGLFVRGGNTGNNRIEFNQVPIYSYTHLLGLFSAFAPDMIEKSTFKPGGIPASSGNLSSSLLQITPKLGTQQSFSGKLSLSPYMTGGYLSLPLKKDTLSVQVSGRTSFLPWVVNAVDDGEGETKAHVVDICSIIDWQLSDKHRMDAMFYLSSDYFDYKDSEIQTLQEWGSHIFKLGWHWQGSPRLNTSLYTYYNHTYAAQQEISFDSYSEEDDKTSDLRIGTTLDEVALHGLMHYQWTPRLAFKGGLEYRHQQFIPSTEKVLFKNQKQLNYTPKLAVNAISLHAQMQYQISKRYSFLLGTRLTHQSGETSNHTNIDFHALSDIYITKQLGLELSYDKMVQYFHVFEGLPTGWSFNIMTPADASYPEEITHQLYTGLFLNKKWGETSANFTLGAYAKNMHHLVSYTSTVNLFGINDATWQDEVALGKGSSRGLECSAILHHKRLGSTLAYTLSKTDRQFNEINEGRTFPFKFDKRHILNAQFKYKLVDAVNKKGYKKQHFLNTVVAYSTGHKATLPIGTYQGILPPYWDQRQNGVHFPDQVDANAYHRQQMTDKNTFQLKDYFRVDAAYTMAKYRPKATYEISFSVFNILNRKNPYLYFYADDKWKQLSIAPVMPSLRWAVWF